MEKASIIHSNLSDSQLIDKSVYNNLVYNTNKQIVSTASVGIPAINSLMPDGVLSSSAGITTSGSPAGAYVLVNDTITDFTMESWFYLNNSGSGGAYSAFVSTLLLNANFNTSNTTLGLVLGIEKNTGKLITWQDGTYKTATNLIPEYNQWNHIAVQKSGSNAIVYLNGTGSAPIAGACTINNNHFGYSLAGSAYDVYDFNGYAKEFILTDRVKSQQEIQNYYNAVINNLSGSYADPSGAIKQGGDGGDGYVAVISYKY